MIEHGQGTVPGRLVSNPWSWPSVLGLLGVLMASSAAEAQQVRQPLRATVPRPGHYRPPAAAQPQPSYPLSRLAEATLGRPSAGRAAAPQRGAQVTAAPQGVPNRSLNGAAPVVASRPAGAARPTGATRPAGAVQPASHVAAAAAPGSSIRDSAVSPANTLSPIPAESAIISDSPSYTMHEAGACGPDCAECGSGYGMGGVCSDQMWLSADYIFWWAKGDDLPALVTTSPTTTPRDDAGVLGLPSTRVLFGGDRVDDNPVPGWRIQFGHWMDAGQQRGWGLEYFAMNDSSTGFSADSSDVSVLGRPFFNTLLNEEDALLLAFPNELTGSIGVSSEVSMQSWGAFLRVQRAQTCQVRLDSTLGYRHYDFDESLLIQNELRFIDPNGTAAVGTTIAQRDQFDVENQFDGGELGLLGRSEMGSHYLDLGARVALGNMQRDVQIGGQTVTTTPNAAATTTTGGLLTQTSNIGSFSDDQFTFIPQFSANIGWRITPRTSLTCGYTLLYLTDVIRPGDLIDNRVNLSQQTNNPTGTLTPVLSLDETNVWLQGLNLGVEMHW